MPVDLEEALRLVRSVTPPTPLNDAGELASGRQVLLKREDLGPNGAFKWRGALCACAAMRADGAPGVVTSSTGNHGAAVAWAAARLGLAGHVVVPRGANPRKRELILAVGAKLHEHGANLDQASEQAKELAERLDFPYLEDGGHTAQIAGTATIGLELRAAEADTVLVPLGCGALAAGVGLALADTERDARVIGVQSTSYARFAALFHGRPDPLLPSGATIADGLAENRIVEPAFSLCRKHLADVLEVDDDALIEASRTMWVRLGVLVEPAGAAPLAALTRFPDVIPGRRVILIVSGANADRAHAKLITAP